MPLYANPPPYVWHKIETLHLSYSAMPTFVPPTPPVLVPPSNPFGSPPEPEPEPKAPADEKQGVPADAEAHASEEAPPAEPGMYLDSL
ncbi:hypothetical protein HO173_007715 [Letharia columbiana]|uniref:Uncharacterized protein n=1 Tax=Letharia columbiana TaxID=112416 RepID=A0A8H6FT85_9LECA|nr:uncharacterized protein HO173_007715 [Letharia columbiana]KAF6234293.1 hypothetical protein HO173_007715 [Letharia columbiana]